MSEPKRRRVYYLPGFDPRGAGHYHGLYRRESAKHATARITTGARAKVSGFMQGWTIAADWPEGRAETGYRFLVWDDLIRRMWIRRPIPALAAYGLDLARYARSGALRAALGIGRGTLLAGLLPALVLAGPVLAALAGYAIGGAVLAVLLLAGGLVAAGVAARRLNLVWFINICRFCVGYGRGEFPGIDRRLAAFADGIVADSKSSGLQPLIIAHSAGAVLAVPLAGLLLDRGITPAVVTLGGCMPFTSLMPDATAYKAALARLASRADVTWDDYASLSDVLSFARVDPLEVSGVRRDHPGSHRRIQVKIVHMFDREVYRRMKRDRMRIHFQYLMAAERETGYDFFRLTAGPK